MDPLCHMVSQVDVMHRLGVCEQLKDDGNAGGSSGAERGGRHFHPVLTSPGGEQSLGWREMSCDL